MLRRHEVCVCPLRFGGGKLEHLREDRSDHDWRIGARRGSCVRSRFHPAQVLSHVAVRFVPGQPAHRVRSLGADAQAQDETVPESFREGPCRANCSRRLAHKDIGDSRGQHQPFGGGQQVGRMRKRFASGALRYPERAVAKFLDCPRELSPPRPNSAPPYLRAITCSLWKRLQFTVEGAVEDRGE